MTSFNLPSHLDQLRIVIDSEMQYFHLLRSYEYLQLCPNNRFFSFCHCRVRESTMCSIYYLITPTQILFILFLRHHYHLPKRVMFCALRLPRLSLPLSLRARILSHAIQAIFLFSKSPPQKMSNEFFQDI